MKPMVLTTMYITVLKFKFFNRLSVEIIALGTQNVINGTEVIFR